MEKFYNLVYFITITLVMSAVGYFFFFYGTMTLGYNPPFEINLVPAYISLVLGYIMVWPALLYWQFNSLIIETPYMNELLTIVFQGVGYAIMWYIYRYIKKLKK